MAAGLVMVVGLLPQPAFPQNGDIFMPPQNGWQTYVNNDYGFRIEFPADVFTPQPPPESRDGRTFAASDATLQIYAFRSPEGDPPATLKDALVGTEGYENVTYSPSGDGWLVLSGFRGDNIFYEKYFFRGGLTTALGIEFPADRKPFYAPLIERMEDSFRAGRSD